MDKKDVKTLTPAEREIMEVLWDSGEATAEEVRQAFKERGRDITGGSIRKILSILMEKGFVTRRRDGKPFIYSATVPRAEANRNLLREMLGRAFGGSAALMVASLLDTNAVGWEELEQIKEVIEKKEEEN